MKNIITNPLLTRKLCIFANIRNEHTNTIPRQNKAMRPKLLIIIFLIVVFDSVHISGQNQTAAFAFLELPISAHAVSTGGSGVSIPDEDPYLLTSNPALLSNVNRKYIGLDYMSWLSSTKIAGALFCSLIDEYSSYAVTARYFDYGTMKQTTADNTETGTFSAKDIIIGGTYSYRLNENWRGGITGNFIYSHYSYLSSVAIGIDMGLNYYNSESNFSFGIAATNLGGQIKAFENTFEHLPFDLVAGVSWKLAHAPLRITVAMNRLNRWDSEYFSTAEDEDLKFGTIFARHISFGTDIILSDQLYVALGCNLNNRAMFSDKGNKGLEGFSIGTGLKLKKVIFGLSYAKYQVSTSSLLFNFAYNI